MSPKPNPKPKSNPNAPSFADLLNSAKTKRKQTEEKTHNILFGTGLTKRAGERQEKKLEKQAERTFDADNFKDITGDSIAPDGIVLTPEFTADTLPSTMMDSNIHLDKDQHKALIGLEFEKFGCIVGGAGTGKTTVSKQLIAQIEKTIPTIDLNQARLEKDRKPVPDFHIGLLICSFTGKAVQNIKRALPKEYHALCDTIHGALGYCPEVTEYLDKETGEWKEKRIFTPTFTAVNKLPFKFVIIDETGTVPITLWNNLIAALPYDCRVIMMGDINQIPPVQGRSVLGFAMNRWPTFGLEKIHRQKGDSAIIPNAYDILHGKEPEQDDQSFLILDLPGGSLDTLEYTCNVIKKLHQKGKFNPMEDSLIVPQNKSVIGQTHINEKLVKYFNPVKKVNGIPINPRIIIKAGYHQVMFAIGDKVMILNNDRRVGLTNGMVGIVESLGPNPAFKGEAQTMLSEKNFDDMFDDTNLDFSDQLAIVEAEEQAKTAEEELDENERQASHIMKVKFQNVDEPVTFQTAGAFKKLAHSYAITCHKSQGGEYPTVVILLHSANMNMLTREWLYTAVTRAQKRVILLCNKRGLAQALRSQRIKGKTIEEKMKYFIELEANETTEVPNLPAPEKIVNEEKLQEILH